MVRIMLYLLVLEQEPGSLAEAPEIKTKTRSKSKKSSFRTLHKQLNLVV